MSPTETGGMIGPPQYAVPVMLMVTLGARLADRRRGGRCRRRGRLLASCSPTSTRMATRIS